jgi:hypothetical protein
MHFRGLMLRYALRLPAAIVLVSVFLQAGCSGWLSPTLAADRRDCPVTRPPQPPFTPPVPYASSVGSHEFLYGSSALWAVVYPDWHIHSGGKLPFFRQATIGKRRDAHD